MSDSKLDIDLIRKSEFFDANWYSNLYKDVFALGMDAAEHFLRFGALLSRDPGPKFSTSAYLNTNPAVAAKGMNALVHYLKYGRREGRLSFNSVFATTEEAIPEKGKLGVRGSMQLIADTSLFDVDHYLKSYRDVREKGMNPLLHYVKYGAREGRWPNAWFDTRFYRNAYMSQDDATNPLVHYLSEPGSELYATSAEFDGHSYMAGCPRASHMERKPLDHYLAEGILEGRRTKAQSAAHTAVPHIINPNSKRCTVVIPIYNASEPVLDCIFSVLRQTRFGEHDSLLLINDGSTDPAISVLLDTFTDIDGIAVHHNAANIGYTCTANRAIDLAGSDDVVLLNSDTVVGPHWLRNLKVTAYRRDHVGTVTAVSDNAGAFSVPQANSNELPFGIDLETVARAVSDCALDPIEVPTGNGFCMYIKRQLINAIGGFDELSFPQGYGEENDFCMRGLQAGWTHLVDPAVFVHHVRSASFGDRKQQLAQAGGERVKDLHPQYEGAPAAIAHSPALAAARRRVSGQFRALARKPLKAKPRIMFVISTRTGGTPQANRDLMQGLSEIYDCLALCSDRRAIEVLSVANGDYELLDRYQLTDPIRFTTHVSGEYDDIVRGILLRRSIDCLHIRHLAWHSLNLVAIAKSLGITVVHSFHDYYAATPGVTLMNEQASEPEEIGNPLWRHDPTSTTITPQYLQAWQRSMQRVLDQCDAFITTCNSARDNLSRVLPELRERAADFHVVPHGRDFDRFEQLADFGDVGIHEPLRVLLPGNIGLHKGMHLIRAVKQLDVEGKIEFHLLGKCDPYLRDAIIDHGAYQRSCFSEIVANIRPHISGILSVVPETYCHTLTESWACGVPAIGIDIGAIGERISKHGGGWLLDRSLTAETLYSALLRIRASPSERLAKLAEVLQWQQGYGRVNTIAHMTRQYLPIYRAVMRRARQIAQTRTKRTALVLDFPWPKPFIDDRSALSRCEAWLKEQFGQHVDVVDYSALLRAEAAAWSVLVVQKGVVPKRREAELAASLAELGNCQVLQFSIESLDVFMADQAAPAGSDVCTAVSRPRWDLQPRGEP